MVLSLGFGVGFILTAWGLVGAFVAARRDLTVNEAMFSRHEAIQREELAEGYAGIERGWTLEEQDVSIALYRARHAENGWPRPSGMNEPEQSGLEAIFVLRKLLTAARSNLILAGVGLFVTTVTSIAALFL